MKTLFNQYQKPCLIPRCNQVQNNETRAQELLEDAIAKHINTLPKQRSSFNSLDLEEQMNYYLSVAG